MSKVISYKCSECGGVKNGQPAKTTLTREKFSLYCAECWAKKKPLTNPPASA